MARLHGELEQMLSGLREHAGRMFGGEEYPPVNVYAKGENLVVTVELPGMRQEDIELSVTGNTLAIKGERKPEVAPDGVRYHRRERKYGAFVRAIQLPEEVDADKAAASYGAGILTVTLPRAEAARPRKIEVR